MSDKTQSVKVCVRVRPLFGKEIIENQENVV